MLRLRLKMLLLLLLVMVMVRGHPLEDRVMKTDSGTSHVKVDSITAYVAAVEYYIGNTSNRTTEEDIKTFLTRCAATLMG